MSDFNPRLKGLPQKSGFFTEKSKLSFYHRKMQRSVLFQNIFGFLENRQVSTDLSVETWAYYHVFREIFACKLFILMTRQGSDNFFYYIEDC